MRVFLLRVIQGVAIGVCAILPGVSGGVLAVTMDLYERMVKALRSFFRDVRANFLFLLPIFIGGVIGVLGASNSLKLFFDNHYGPVTVLFCGFVLGNLPWLLIEARGERRDIARNILSLIAGLAFILAVAYFESTLTSNEVAAFLSPKKALLAGAVLAVGIIVPGVSASFLLLYMGTYSAILTAIAHVDLSTLFYVGIGFLLAAALLIGLVDRMLSKYHALSYFAIIGFSLGSVAIVIPSVIPHLTWICPFLFVVGLALSVTMGYFKARKLGMDPPPDAIRSEDRTAANGAQDGKDAYKE